MIAYERKKIRANYPDNHPRKPHYNWWEELKDEQDGYR
jgi:hypothetical protein